MRPRNVALQILVGSRPGERHHCWSQRECRGKAVLVDIENEKIRSERLVGQLADCGRASANLVDLHTPTTQCAETTSIRHCGDKRRRVDRGHAPVSFVLAARWRGFSDARARDIATNAALAYRSEMAVAVKENTLDTWYATITWEDILRDVKDDPAVSKRLREVVVAAKHHTSEYVFHKITTLKGNKVRLLDQPPLLYHPPGMNIPAVAEVGAACFGLVSSSPE